MRPRLPARSARRAGWRRLLRSTKADSLVDAGLHPIVMRSLGTQSRRARLAISIALALLASVRSTTAASTSTTPPEAPVVKLESGSLSVEARDLPLEEVLDAIAARTDIDVVIQRGIERPRVNVHIESATLEEALRRILRRRNYALLFRRTEEGSELAQVRVLRPKPAPPENVTPAQARRQRLERLRSRKR